jgi:predicted ATPase/DNA-binding SARP family transcriptional activator
MASIQIGVLGPVDATVDSAPVALGATKQRAVLAMLALNANRALSVDRLAEGLWGQHPPASAAKMIQMYVSQLRRLLGATAIVTRGRAYELRVAPDAVDAERFARMLRGGDGDARAALRLWRGPALADVADEPFAAAEIRRLDELRMSALEAAVEVDLRRGRHAEALTELEPLIAANPLRERLHAHRMLALYRNGRQAEALDAYRAARDTLVEELGLEPSPELRNLHEAILRQDPALEARAAARRLPNGTVSMLFTDIEGSTRLLQEHGTRRFAGMLGEQQSLVRGAAERHGGVEVHTAGDALFFAFTTARDAAAAAREAQAALEGGPVHVRMGIHTGEPEIHDDDYVGIDAHRAARITSAAHGGQVALSERTRALLGDAFECAPLGVHRLKDLREREKLFQLGIAAFPPLRSLNASNLPAPPSRLVGRRAELGALRQLLREHRLVTLTGPGGTGKTRLGLEATAQCSDEFDDGVWWSPLAAVSEPDLVLPTVAQALGAQGPLAEHIDERRMLILLDNLEQVIGCAPAISALLAACPNLTLLVTSRTPLRLRAEREYAVAPLELDDAVELFVARAVRSEPVAVVRAICARVDALPLAVELAAARTRAFAPAELLERLDRRLALLTDGPIDAPDRHAALRATIAWSHELLAADESEHFARVSVFAGSFDAAAARAVCGTRLETLESLIEQSLLARTQSGRFFMLETIREFAAEQLGPQPDLQRRHAEHYVEVARSAGLTDDSDGAMRHDLIVRDRDNVRAALDWARDADAGEVGLLLAASLENYWVTQAPAEGQRRLRDLLARATESLSPDLRALALRVCGSTSEMAGDAAGGRHHYELALEQYRRNDDRRGVGIVLGRLAHHALGLGEIDRARELTEESSRLVDETGFVRGQAIAAQLFAGIERAGGDHDRAVELLARSVELAASSGFTWWEGVTLLELAELELERDRTAQAEARAREALVPLAQVGDRQNVVYALATLARVAAQDGRQARAGRLWGAIEAEEARGPVGMWEQDREQFARPVLVAAGPRFDAARAEGRVLALAEAIAFAASD